MSEIELFNSVTDEQKMLVAAWWEAFCRDEGHIKRCFSDEKSREVFSVPDWMIEHLGRIDERLMWEYGPALGEGDRLVITPESHQELRPLVRYLLNTAPDLEGWEFYDYRLASSIETLSEFTDSRIGKIDWSSIRVKLEEGQFHEIDVLFAMPFNKSKEECIDVQFILLEKVLGEEVLDKWVGVIDVVDVKDVDQGQTAFFPIEKLASKFKTKMASIKDRIPQTYIGIGDQLNWLMYEMEPKEQDDYSGKSDIFVYRFIESDLFPLTFSYPESFYSERYARSGEIFIYLKMDGAAEDLNQEHFAAKSEIEDALEEVLGAQKIGAVIGSGTGLRYSYIDMLLCDPRKALSEIQRVLREGKLTKRSWILFHDADMRTEWIGVWDDAVAPPM